MRFPLDQDVYATTAHFLTALGHDVVLVAEIGLSRASDSDLLKTAHEQGRVFVTRDKDFGGLVFVEDLGDRDPGCFQTSQSREVTAVEAVSIARFFGLVERPNPSWRMVLGPGGDLGFSRACYAIGSPAKG